MMSHVLQCTQFDALICSRGVPSGVADDLVDVRRTEARARVAVLGSADRAADLGVHQQVRRLILVVRGARVVHVGHLVERQPPIDRRRRCSAGDGRHVEPVVPRQRLHPLVPGVAAQVLEPPAAGQQRQARRTPARRTARSRTPGARCAPDTARRAPRWRRSCPGSAAGRPPTCRRREPPRTPSRPPACRCASPGGCP